MEPEVEKERGRADQRRKPITHEQALDAAFALIDSVFNNASKRHSRHNIPAQMDDDDVLIVDYIRQQEESTRLSSSKGKGNNMIVIQQSPTADKRTCDFTNTSKETLHASSVQHIEDVRKGLYFFRQLIEAAEVRHDFDKLTDIEGFHRDFVTVFKQTTWWDNHRKVNRHHLLQADGVPADVNLIDVLDMIADCVMAGMARSGSVYALNISPELLKTAFDNTVELLKAQVVVERAQPDAVKEKP